MIKIEIDDDAELTESLRKLHDAESAARRAYRVQWESLPEAEREGLPEPVDEGSLEETFERALTLGVGDLSARPPNEVLLLCGPARDADGATVLPSLRKYARGERLSLCVPLPIGAEIITIETSKVNGPNWDVFNFTVGCMNLVSPEGSFGGVPLSDFRRITRKDLLSDFDHKKTKFDVQVRVDLICKTDGATFDGFRIYTHRAEHDVIWSRLEPVKCDHPEDRVKPLLYVDAERYYEGQHVPHFGQRRYRCGACGRLVVKDEGGAS